MLVAFVELLIFQSSAYSTDYREFKTIIKFNVTDDITSIERAIGRSLILKIERVNAVNNANFGWELSVVRKPGNLYSRNYLYHSLEWHGPYPTDIFAWIHKENYFPDERILPVHGYPYELRVRLLNIETKGNDSETEFTAGTVEIAVRRLRTAVEIEN